MDITFVVCKNKSAKAVAVITKVLGPSKAVTYDDFHGEFENCSTVAMVCSFEHGQPEQEISDFINHYSEQLKTKKIALIGTAENEFAGSSIVQNIAEKLGECVAWAGCIDTCDMENHQSISEETAVKLIAIKRRLKDSADMPRELLQQAIDEFLHLHNTCALCTGQNGDLRVTPIEYVYFQNAIYFLSEGGEKFAHLAANPHASLAIYDAYTGFNSLGGLQVEGFVQTVALFSEEYNHVVTQKGLNASNMKKLPVTLHMFKVLPKRFELLESALTKSHYSAKQVLESFN